MSGCRRIRMVPIGCWLQGATRTKHTHDNHGDMRQPVARAEEERNAPQCFATVAKCAGYNLDKLSHLILARIAIQNSIYLMGMHGELSSGNSTSTETQLAEAGEG